MLIDNSQTHALIVIKLFKPRHIESILCAKADRVLEFNFPWDILYCVIIIIS